MKSVSEILSQLGLGHDRQSEDAIGWQLLDQMRAEGSVVLVKLDGERTLDPYTLVISGGPLGENYFRKDGSSINELIAEGANFYDGLIWRGEALDPQV
ncbi:hypothetical protein OKA04_21755 [Luteolibacter flavescens]|uniref:Uncharacterized protein n=1 Tax=Luteolibacter flavescens TaxID=1859460 RepID=A0ABT3FUY3_9BACT|nr:hypothetical protein [Luteolibacter flavescens]MCW1887378.1 hypothetical protein [Luteolibacter flavescens]